MRKQSILVFIEVLIISATASSAVGAQQQTPRLAKNKARVTSQENGSEQTVPLVQIDVVRTKLKNGLRVVMNPDRTVPTVAVAIYYDVGSRNEVRGRSGFAHLFEHMMFQGSRNVGKMEHFQFIAKRGGDTNGSTSQDRTNYYETLPSHELALGLWLEADRMRSLKVTQKNFENQQQTVMEERRQSYDNQPYMKSMLRINELAYGDYWPYAHSTIGDMQDLQKAPLKAAQDFFSDYYTPKNAVLSIAGDFDPDKALKLVEKYFSDIPGRDAPAYNPGELTPQNQERVETMNDPLAQLPAFHIAYHIPPDRHPDHYPLEMFEVVLGDGESSRLYQELVKKRELLQEIQVGTDGRRGPDLFSFWGICAKGRSAEKARQLIYAQIDEIAQKGVTQRELEKARNRVRAAFLFGLQSNLSRAQRLAEYEMYFGDANLLKNEFEHYRAVSENDIKRVARQYFAESNRTVLDVIPAKSNDRARRQP